MLKSLKTFLEAVLLRVEKCKDHIFGCVIVKMLLMNGNKIQYLNMESLFSTRCPTIILHSLILFLVKYFVDDRARATENYIPRTDYQDQSSVDILTELYRATKAAHLNNRS